MNDDTLSDDMIAAAVAEVRERMEAAASRAGRRPDEITLVAATKTVPPAHIAAAVAAGVRDLGENRAQELLAKAPVLAGDPELAGHDLRWHFLGHLQRNKVRALAGLVGLWHSVDRVALGAEIAKRSPGAAVLVEVNLGAEASKAGVAPSGAGALVEELAGLDLDVRGLMAIPPRDGPPGEGSSRKGEARRWFDELADLGADLGLEELSMGMTEDFEEAIEAGATIVRIGRGIFGSEARR